MAVVDRYQDRVEFWNRWWRSIVKAIQRSPRSQAFSHWVFSARAEHWFAVSTGLLAAFMLRSVTPLSVKKAPRALAIVGLLTLPIGYLLVTGLLPGVRSLTTRLALITASGYAVSVTGGYLLGAVGRQGLYLPVCMGLAGLSLVHLVLAARRVTTPEHDLGAILQSAGARLWNSRPAWLVLGIGFLSVIAVTPVLAPMQHVAPNLYIDYAFTDNYYHLIRAALLSFGAPLGIWPEMAGVQAYVYPDYHNFWVGQVAFLSHADVRQTFYIYVPISMVFARVCLLYAAGREFTGSVWGGFIAAALAYIVLLPNPYDTNLFFSDSINTWPEWTSARLHFLEFRSNLAYGIGWQMLSGVALVLAVFPKHRDTRTGLGLLVMAGLLIASLLRIRSHYFVILAGLYGLVLVGLLLWRRRWTYLIPLMTMGAMIGLVTLESTSRHYNTSTADLSLRYGPFGEAVLPWLPDGFRQVVMALPDSLRPFLSVLTLDLLQMVGFFFGIIVAGWLFYLLRRRLRPTLAEGFLLGAAGATFLAALLVIINAWENLGGNWGGQVGFLLRGIALLLAIKPLYWLMRAVVQRLGWRAPHQVLIMLLVLALFTVSTYRAASATLRNQTMRAYPITAEEQDAYYWVEHNTPPTAVVATHPDYVVSYSGATVGTVSFLSGVTLRPAYLQFAWFGGIFYPAEVEFRRALLEGLYTTASVTEAKRLVSLASFNYLLVYDDMPSRLDLECCLTLVRDGNPKIYQVPHPAPPVP